MSRSRGRWTAWVEVKRREAEAGDRSPTYVRELERFAKPEGYFSWWAGRSIHEIDYGMLEDWSLWLADRGLSPKTRRNVLGAFHSFLGWLRRRGDTRGVPELDCQVRGAGRSAARFPAVCEPPNGSAVVTLGASRSMASRGQGGGNRRRPAIRGDKAYDGHRGRSAGSPRACSPSLPRAPRPALHAAAMRAWRTRF